MSGLKANFDRMLRGSKPGEEPRRGGSSRDQTTSSASEGDLAMKRSRGGLTEDEYEFIARDIMSKPPMSGYLKYHLPLRYAARTEEVRWTWADPNSGRQQYQELIGGGKNSDLEYD